MGVEVKWVRKWMSVCDVGCVEKVGIFFGLKISMVVVARISPCYRGRNASLMPIGHKGRFLLMAKMQKNETRIVETE